MSNRNRAVNFNEKNEDYLCFDYFRLQNAPDYVPQKEKMTAFIFKAAKKCLTEKQRQCFFAYYLQNKKQIEIAGELGISKSGVSRHIQKAKVRLQSFAELYR